MAEITNPQAVKFCNEKCRTLADQIQRMDRTLSQFMLLVVRDWESVAEVDAAQNTDLVVDGSATDGRPPVTRLNVGELKYVIEQLQACMNTDDRRAVVNKWAVNGQPIY